jgi:hypothetical protein
MRRHPLPDHGRDVIDRILRARSVQNKIFRYTLLGYLRLALRTR